MKQKNGAEIARLDGVRTWVSRNRSLDDRTAVVMLPGLGAGLEFLIPLAEVVSKRYSVIITDIPGFGESAWPKYKSLEDLTSTLWRMLERLSLKDFILVGQSSGGLVALDLALPAATPHIPRCIGICMIGGSHYRSIRLIQRQLSWRESVSLLPIALATLIGGSCRLPTSIRRRLLARPLLRRALLWPYLASPRQVDPRTLSRMLTNSGSHNTLRFARALRQFDLVDALERVDVPFALLTGDRDRYITDVDRSYYMENANVVADDTLVGCGHWATVEEPELTASWLLAAIHNIDRSETSTRPKS